MLCDWHILHVLIEKRFDATYRKARARGIIVWKPAKSAGTKETLSCYGHWTCMGAKAVWSESHLRGWISIVSGHLLVMSEFSYGARHSIGEWQTLALELKWSLSMKYPSWRYDPWVFDIQNHSFNSCVQNLTRRFKVWLAVNSPFQKFSS